MNKLLKTYIKYTILYFITLTHYISVAQDHFYLKNDVSNKINFELASNLIIIPIEINGVTLSFILDTGVSKPILFNLTEHDSLDLKNIKTFYLHGLGGDGKLEAIKSSYNRLKIGNALKVNQDVYVVFDDKINFAPRLGVYIHGIIGYDIFKDFIVEINYSSKYIRLHKPDMFKPKRSKKWKAVPLDIHKNKAYLNAKVVVKNDSIPVKLLIDTGSSDALWLFENKEIGLTPKKELFFVDYLGRGLSGSVYGKRSKVKEFSISDFSLKFANVAFPDSTSINIAKVYKERHGSLGGDILKRFNLFFDYTNKKLYLKKNNFFKERFTYNNSGIVLEHNGTRFVKEDIRILKNDENSFSNDKNGVQINFAINYIMSLKPIYTIVELREDSPNANASGVRIGDDILTRINNRNSI